MSTRDHRLGQFDHGPPPTNEPLQLLCEDHNGTYVLPFQCEWRNGEWHNLAQKDGNKSITAKVVGWRSGGKPIYR